MLTTSGCSPLFTVLMQAHASKLFFQIMQDAIKLKVTPFNDAQHIFDWQCPYILSISPWAQSQRSVSFAICMVLVPYKWKEAIHFWRKHSLGGDEWAQNFSSSSYKIYCRYKIYFQHYNIWMILVSKHLAPLWDVQSRFKSFFWSTSTMREQKTSSGEKSN